MDSCARYGLTAQAPYPSSAAKWCTSLGSPLSRIDLRLDPPARGEGPENHHPGEDLEGARLQDWRPLDSQETGHGQGQDSGPPVPRPVRRRPSGNQGDARRRPRGGVKDVYKMSAISKGRAEGCGHPHPPDHQPKETRVIHRQSRRSDTLRSGDPGPKRLKTYF